MNTTAVHETFAVLPADSVAYHCNPEGSGRKSKNPPMPAHLRWADAMNDRQWGWRVAMTHHASGEPLPPSLRDPSICLLHAPCAAKRTQTSWGMQEREAFHCLPFNRAEKLVRP
jgi:hypothetical protein